MQLKKLRNDLGPLAPMAAFAIITLTMLAMIRAGLAAWQWDRIIAVEDPWRLVTIGLQLDLQLLSYLLILPAVLYMFTASRSILGNGAALVTRVWLTLATVLVVFMETATPSFIEEYGIRPNRLFLEYLIYPREVFSMLWAQYKPQLFIASVLIPLAAWGAWAVFGWSLRQRTGWSLVRYLLVFPLLAALLALGARSSLGHRPANSSTAAFSSDPLVNDLALNSTYSVMDAAYRMKDEKDAGKFYGLMDEEEIVRRVRQAMDAPESVFTYPALPTLHRQTASRQIDRPYNLVIVLEESLGAQFVETLGGRPLTPRLVQLSAEGLWFENLYATGTRSVRGIEAVTTGFLPTPGRSVVKLSSFGKPFFNLAGYLKGYGYQSVFVYGGESNFDNMRGFFLRNGFDRIVDEQDFATWEFKGTWGVSDEDLFVRANQEFEAYGDQPFMGLIFSSSYHSPFEFPEGRLTPEELSDNPEHNAIRYADYALGRFFELARRSSYWKRTIFLVVADHDSRVRGANLVPIRHFNIPGLIIGPGISPTQYTKVASQIDLPPTLLSLMGISGDHPMVGRDLTLPPRPDGGRAIMQYANNQAYRIGDQVIILQPEHPPTQYTYRNLELVDKKTPDPELAADALAHALWPSLAYYNQYYTLP
jgi:phosphoglycerol transferase MdoB-like AlkP superfamily enzyme